MLWHINVVIVIIDILCVHHDVPVHQLHHSKVVIVISKLVEEGGGYLVQEEKRISAVRKIGKSSCKIPSNAFNSCFPT